MRRLFIALALACLGVMPAFGQDKDKKKEPLKLPPATVTKMAYGKHERQVLDLWQAKANAPTPMVIFIHGGSWKGGDKSNVGLRVQMYLDAGISVASINYRYVQKRRRGENRTAREAPLDGRASRCKRFALGEARNLTRNHRAQGGSPGACSSLRRVSRRHGRPEEQRSDRPRIDAGLLCGRRGLKRRSIRFLEGMVAQLHVWRSCVRLEGFQGAARQT